MSDAPPISPTAPSSNDTPISDPLPKYVPQFSAATEMILKRIQNGAGNTINSTTTLSSIGITGTPPGYEDMRRSVLMGMKTTLNMDIPSTPTTNRRGGVAGKATGGAPIAPRPSATPKSRGSVDGVSASGRKTKSGPRTKGGRVGGKRKRAKSESMSEEESDAMSKLGEDSDSDDTEEITVFPKVTQSGRHIVKPAQFVPATRESNPKRRAPSKKAQEQALCKRCGRGHSPETNMIVFCDGCNSGWHQMCHDPPISEEMVKDEMAPWFCLGCSRKKGNKSGSQPRPASWQGRSSEEKRSYFNSLPHPQLVNLLMQATVLHPNIPIFPQSFNAPSSHAQRATSSSDRQSHSHQSQQSFPQISTTGLFSRQEAHPNAPINFIRKIHTGQTSPASFSPSQSSFNHVSSAPPALNAQGKDSSRESTPASPPYPKPGNGLMARLGPDEDDIEWLVDNNDFDAFSHVVYDEHGERMEENSVLG
ncbi:hypothetical protein BJ875DRAFT_512196 [Amylocarpus encephaloides]|uniref:PHD-type domain-containing protein n=1 Tax=Amylocarpus encephaloides TaxID=45428 RepID=A0A9P8C4F2_9HELO|nr:hypothetical protein BJ875DRAFT_512196 [Amylocarpus encephaloides]